MSHHKYHTEALVIGVTPQGEGDLRVVLVAKELGVVRATARGARLMKSKNRMSLVEGTQVLCSLVKGRDVWRLTNVVFKESFYPRLAQDSKKQKIAWNVHLLLRKIVPHDVLPTNLYYIVHGLWQTLSEEQAKESVALAKAAECIALLNIVHDLGYLGEDLKWQPYIGVFKPTDDLLREMSIETIEASKTINNSLKETHL